MPPLPPQGSFRTWPTCRVGRSTYPQDDDVPRSRPFMHRLGFGAMCRASCSCIGGVRMSIDSDVQAEAYIFFQSATLHSHMRVCIRTAVGKRKRTLIRLGLVMVGFAACSAACVTRLVTAMPDRVSPDCAAQLKVSGAR